MFMRNKGYTLLEVVISIFLISIILFGSAMAIKTLGIITGNGVNDIVYRRNINKFAGDMKNGVASLLAAQDKSYSGFTNAGLVINNVDELTETTLPNGDIKKVYKTTDITMYMIGAYHRRDIYISTDAIQENKDLSYYGLLNMRDKKLNKDEFNNGNIVWDDIATYNPIKVSTEQFMNGTTEKTEFVITTVNDKLSSIKVTLLIPSTKGYNRKFDMVFTCVQEVLVSVR